MKIVVALGGNALLKAGQEGTAEEQLENIELACRQLIRIAHDHDLVITHGNGPQVGKIHMQNEVASEISPSMPLDICGAMSQGQIGYLLQQGLNKELARQGVMKDVATVITRVQVDKDDPSFQNPTKPIGTFYSREEAEKQMKEKGEVWVEDKTRGGWRKVVPSPMPSKILEENIVKNLVDSGCLVIASGGGGVPVVESEESGYDGIEAVIDKDLAGELLASIVDADAMVILTDVPEVYINYGTPEQKTLSRISVNEMEKYEKEGHFAAGSMGPKVEAAIKFARKDKKTAIITSLEQAREAITGQAGTCLIGEE
ncbi:MAG: carbamate kinase [Bacillota bacterium]